MQEQHQLLVVRSAAPDTRVEEQDPAGIIHDAGERAGLPFVESEHLRVRAPEEPSDLDASGRETGEQFAEARTARTKELIVVPPPIHEQHLVLRAERRETIDEPREVRGPVDQRLDTVADGPGGRLATGVDRRGGVAPLGRRQEPVARPVNRPRPRGGAHLGDPTESRDRAGVDAAAAGEKTRVHDRQCQAPCWSSWSSRSRWR